MNTLNDFADLLEKALIPVEASAALDTAAAVIEHEAKREIGTYQRSDMGPYEAWPELAESTKAERVRQGYSENDPLLRSGELRDSISRETHGLEAVVGSDSDVMVYQEFGTRTIPPRPVLGLAAVRSHEAVLKIVGDGVFAALVGSWFGLKFDARKRIE